MNEWIDPRYAEVVEVFDAVRDAVPVSRRGEDCGECRRVGALLFTSPGAIRVGRCLRCDGDGVVQGGVS